MNCEAPGPGERFGPKCRPDALEQSPAAKLAPGQKPEIQITAELRHEPDGYVNLKWSMGQVGLRDDQQPRRVLVDSVDDSWSGHASDPRQAPTAMVEQGIYKRTVRISGCRVDNETRGLVHHQQMLVLKDNPQRNVLRNVVRRRWFGDGELEGFVPTNLRSRVANRNRRQGLQRPVPDECLQALPGQGRDCIGECTIQPPSRMARQKLDADDLVAPHVLDMGTYSSTSMRGLVALWSEIIIAVNGATDVLVQGSVEGIGLDKEDCDQPVCWIHPEEGRPGAVPEEFPYGTAIISDFERAAGPDSEIQPETAV